MIYPSGCSSHKIVDPPLCKKTPFGTPLISPFLDFQIHTAPIFYYTTLNLLTLGPHKCLPIPELNGNTAMSNRTSAMESTFAAKGDAGHPRETNNYTGDYYDDPNATYTTEDILEEIRLYIYPTNWMWALICLHIVVFVVGLVGNTLVGLICQGFHLLI